MVIGRRGCQRVESSRFSLSSVIPNAHPQTGVERRRKARRPARPQPPVKRETLGIIVGNRGFFPGHLARTGRDEMLQAFAEEGIDAVLLGPDDSAYGAVESRDES